MLMMCEDMNSLRMQVSKLQSILRAFELWNGVCVDLCVCVCVCVYVCII
jgi:hypothetical protein